jgi:hypothetical protein
MAMDDAPHRHQNATLNPLQFKGVAHAAQGGVEKEKQEEGGKQKNQSTEQTM